MNPKIGARCYGDSAIVEVTAANGTCFVYVGRYMAQTKW